MGGLWRLASSAVFGSAGLSFASCADFFHRISSLVFPLATSKTCRLLSPCIQWTEGRLSRRQVLLVQRSTATGGRKLFQSSKILGLSWSTLATPACHHSLKMVLTRWLASRCSVLNVALRSSQFEEEKKQHHQPGVLYGALHATQVSCKITSWRAHRTNSGLQQQALNS